jgi:predicted permease
MRSLNRLLIRLRNLAASKGGDERLREEMEAHLAAQTEEYLRSGMTPSDARRQARLKFGSLEAVRETYHSEKGLPFLENLMLDIRYALRVLRKSPAFTIVALVTLMLGIGANIVVFGVLNAVVLQPLAVNDPQNLYQLRQKQWMTGRLLTSSYPTFEDLRRRNTTFSGMAGMYGYSNARLNWRNSARKISGYEVTGNYFDFLGVQPGMGRFFHLSDEHGPNSAPYVVLSDGLWRSTFHADPGVIGTTVELDKHPFTVLGVTSASFHGTEKFRWPDYWIPMMNEQQIETFDYLHNRKSIAVTVLGRLKPGVTAQQATENLNAIAAELAKEYPETDDGQPLRLIHPGLIGDEGDVIRGFLYSVSLLALLVLAAACANLATLFAARAADRSRELALRVALGSSRRRLMRQLLTEAVVVSLIGGAAGLGSAYLLLGILNRSSAFAGSLKVSVDARVYLVGLVLTLGSAMLFGLIPARQVWQSSPQQMMKSGPAESTRLHRFALRDLLLGLQIAICTLLVTASLVAVRGLIQALHTPLGIQPQGAMLGYMDLNQTDQAVDLPIGDGAIERVKAILQAVRRVPGVTAVSTVNQTPMTGGLHGVPIFAPGTTEFQLKNSLMTTYVFHMSPEYLDTAGTRLLRGRDVSWHDTAKTPHVAVVNETFAQKMWDKTPALGQRFILQGNLTEVVGVVEDGKYHDLTESPQPALFLPLSQTEDKDAIFVVRSQRTPKEMSAALQQTLSRIAPNAPISVLSWPDQLSGELFPARTATLALGVMGLLAAMLAVTGIFGMAAYNVSRRMKELGIRVALGARKTQVMSAAVGRPMALLGGGSLVGLLAGVFASRFLAHIVYQANPGDPAVLVGAVITMSLLGLAASAIPARRALAIDPSSLMREE